jgi:nitroreductase
MNPEREFPAARKPEAPVDPMFPDRWSPRSFLPDPVPAGDVGILLEAARWTPSCFNEQPWLFLYAVREVDRARFASALSEKNRAWASKAPLLLFLAARTGFARTGKPNRHAAFDAGAAWMSLALQARRLGLYAHAMAGFDAGKARAVLGLPAEGWEILAAVAVGRRGDPGSLPEDLRAAEAPSPRKPLAEVGREGRY